MAYYKSFASIFRVPILLAFVLYLWPLANAQSKNAETQVKAIALATKIQTEQLILDEAVVEAELGSEDLTPADRLSRLRNEFSRHVWTSDKADLSEISGTYNQLARDSGDQRDIDVGTVFATFVLAYDDLFTDETFSNTRLALEPFIDAKDWFVAHQAHYLISMSYPDNANLSLALETAQQGLKLIPAEQSLYGEEARISSVSSLAYLHIMLLNLEHSVTSYTEQINLELKSGKPVDGLAIINNLVYVFSAWREHEAAKELIDILMTLEESHPNRISGLTESRAAKIYAQLGDYKAALRHADKALSACEIESLCKSAEFAKATALAGLGRSIDAKAILKKMRMEFGTEEEESSSAAKRIYEIEALLAVADGNPAQALQFMNRKLDASVQDILSNSNSQTANLLASLQNSKDRRDERASAFQQQAELKQIALDRQQRVTQLLIVLSLILLGVIVGVSAFARYRSKVATRMEISAKKAMAGEKAKAEFLAIMSHELRTPLNGILGMADIIARKADTPDLKTKTGVIVDCGQDLLGLVENIFDMTLIESGDIHLYPERVNVHILVSDLIDHWRPIIENKGVTFTAHIGQDVPEYMEVDKKRLKTPIDALLSNATKFTKNGRVHVHVSAQRGAAQDVSELKVIVADTGVGITDEAQSRLFEPFVQADSSMTRHFGGAGLGLAIARGLAQMMDGDLTVNSRSNRGSEFTLTINAPVLLAPEQTQAEHTQNGQFTKSMTPSGGHQKAVIGGFSVSNISRILIAEDDKACQDVLRSLLEPSGAKLIFTINGKEALEALSLNPYDLVITDIRMPGIDGVTTIQRIRNSRQDHRNIPIIALTADVAAETNTRCRDAGVDAFLTKPINAPDLFAAIARAESQQRLPKTVNQVLAS